MIYPSKVYLKLKFREIIFFHNIDFICHIHKNLCIEHGIYYCRSQWKITKWLTKLSVNDIWRYLGKHDNVIKWKHFSRHWPFVRGIHRMFSLICPITNVWANNRDAGDLRRHRAHYAVIAMNIGFGGISYSATATCTLSSRLRTRQLMMTSSNGNIFLVIGPLRGESTSHRWISLTMASDAELWCSFWSAPEQTAEQTIEIPVIWDAIALIMTSL